MLLQKGLWSMGKIVASAMGCLGLLFGLFLAVDAFMPRSQPTPSGVVVWEFVIGLFTVGLSYAVIRWGRHAV